jgi:predicted RNase H-like HicB family nuclease
MPRRHMAIVFEVKDKTWSAHDPDVEGVYGTGSSREEALVDLAEATTALVDPEAGDIVDEDAEDARIADAAYASALAGGPLYTLKEVKFMLGIEEKSS